MYMHEHIIQYNKIVACMCVVKLFMNAGYSYNNLMTVQLINVHALNKCFVVRSYTMLTISAIINSLITQSPIAIGCNSRVTKALIQ